MSFSAGSRFVVGINNGWFAGQYLDFFDFHVYNTDGSLLPYSQPDFAGKPCIIGECDYPVGNVPYDLTQEVPVAQNFLSNACTTAAGV